MRRIREVLRLHAERRSLGEIAVSLNIGKSTVREYVERGRATGLSWPLPSELDDAALEARLYPASTEVAKRPEPDWLQVRRELSSRRHHVTLSLLWLEYRQAHPDGYGYTQFCVKFRAWQQAQDVVMRFEYRDGERVFIDFCGDTMDVIDPRTGEIEQAQIFCAVLGASGYMYAEAVRSQDLESWLSAHVRMFGFYAGVPEILVVDYVPRHIIRVLCPSELCGRRGREVPSRTRPRPRVGESGHITIRAGPASSGGIRPTSRLAWCGIPPKHSKARYLRVDPGSSNALDRLRLDEAHLNMDNLLSTMGGGSSLLGSGLDYVAGFSRV